MVMLQPKVPLQKEKTAGVVVVVSKFRQLKAAKEATEPKAAKEAMATEMATAMATAMAMAAVVTAVPAAVEEGHRLWGNHRTSSTQICGLVIGSARIQNVQTSTLHREWCAGGAQ